VEKKLRPPPAGWQFETFEVLSGLFLIQEAGGASRLASLGVDAIVALDEWEYTWSPPVPENHLYVHFPIDDGDTVDPKTTEVARLVAGLVQNGHKGPGALRAGPESIRDG
jgi:hypothetical protein